MAYHLSKSQICDGGTLLTNFDHKDRARFEKAVELYEAKYGKSNFVFADDAYAAPRAGGYLMTDCAALHITTGEFEQDMTYFWEMYADSKWLVKLDQNNG